MSGESCANCRFSNPVEYELGVGYQCRFNSPVAIYNGDRVMSTFPFMSGPVWCGNYWQVRQESQLVKDS